MTLHGISAAVANHTNVTGITTLPKNTTVTLSVQLDDLGVLAVTEATLIIPADQGSSGNEGGLTGKIAGFFGGSSKKEGEGEEGTEEVINEEGDKKEDEKLKLKDTQSDLEKAKAALKAENGASAASGKVAAENVVVKLQIIRQELGIRPMSTLDRITSGKL